jgi:pSer/pThr/pTyr-binding forkhead associated (FHA) protein
MWVVRINSTPPQDKTLRKVITVGRHIDNDVIVGGERIADHHARIETDERGSRLVPVQGRGSIEVNGNALSVPFGLKPGDRISIGDTSMSIVDNDDEATIAREEAVRWELEGEDGERSGEHFVVSRVITVGRSDECDVVMKEGHISRRHACLHPIGDEVYLEDLGSANGTYLNGQRIWGAIRLHHGDHVRFDEASFRVYGRTKTVESGPTMVRASDTVGPLPEASTGQENPTPEELDTAGEREDSADPFATAENPEVPKLTEEHGPVEEQEADAGEESEEDDLAKTEVTDLAELESLITEQGESDTGVIETDEAAGDDEEDELPLLKTIAMAPELPTITDGEQIPPTMVMEAERLPPAKDEATEPHRLHGDLPRLLGLTPPVTGEMLTLNPGRMTIGRANDCDLVVSEPSVSSRHAQVIVNASGTTLMNLFSANGTFVNGEPIDTVRLKAGDMIQMGRVEFLYQPNDKMLAQRTGLPFWAYLLLGFGIVAAIMAVVLLL